MVVLEAQRVGCIPIVNNSFTSIPMLVQNGVNGCVVDAFDNKAFAETLSSLMDNIEMQQQMNLQAIESAKRFSLDRVYDRWMELLNEYHEKVS